MSDTPETDSECFEYDPQCSAAVDSDFARKLERERDQSIATNQKLKDHLYDVMDELERLKYEIKKLIK